MAASASSKLEFLDEQPAPVTGSRLSKHDVELLHLEMRRIRREHGVLTPTLLVTEARKPSSPIHHLWDWNDKTAAEKARETLAGYYIRSITMHYKDSGGELKPIRIWVKDPLGPTGAFELTKTVMQDPPRREMLVQLALRDLAAWRRRYEIYEELSELFTVIDEFIAKKKK